MVFLTSRCSRGLPGRPTWHDDIRTCRGTRGRRSGGPACRCSAGPRRSPTIRPPRRACRPRRLPRSLPRPRCRGPTPRRPAPRR
ncbi:hypothetical protein EON77_00275 [bacterium]|nr:MAG: hypothetical protein EON77_00275 [bacterium]